MGTRIGYAAVEFNEFHIRNRTALRHARRHCDVLIAGIAGDETAREATRPSLVLTASERAVIASHSHFIDRIHIASTPHYIDAWRELRFTHLFLSSSTSDGTSRAQLEEQFAGLGVQMLQLDATADRYEAAFWRAVDAVTENAVAVVG